MHGTCRTHVALLAGGQTSHISMARGCSSPTLCTIGYLRILRSFYLLLGRLQGRNMQDPCGPPGSRSSWLYQLRLGSNKLHNMAWFGFMYLMGDITLCGGL